MPFRKASVPILQRLLKCFIIISNLRSEYSILIYNLPCTWFLFPPYRLEFFKKRQRSRINKHVLMPDTKKFRIVLSSFLPDQFGNEVLFTKNLIHQQP